MKNNVVLAVAVVASGLPPPAYQWRFNGTPLAGKTSSSLVISNAQFTNEGDYTVVLTNAAGTNTSPAAHLTVRVGLFPPMLANSRLENRMPAFDATGPVNTKVVILYSPDMAAWTPMFTNATPSGTWHFLDTNAPPLGSRFYRALLQP